MLINCVDFLGLAVCVLYLGLRMFACATYLGLRVFVCATYLGLRVRCVHSRFSCVHVRSIRNKVDPQLITVSPELFIIYLNRNEICSPEPSRGSLPLVASFPIIWFADSTFQDDAAFEILGSCPVLQRHQFFI